MNTEQSEIFGVQKWQWVVVALALVAVVAFMYLYGVRSPYPKTADNDAERFLQQGTSDELKSIEQDLSSTNLIDLDRELADIDAELR